MNQPKGAMCVYGYEKSSNKVNDKKDMNEIHKPYKKGICVHTLATFLIVEWGFKINRDTTLLPA